MDETLNDTLILAEDETLMEDGVKTTSDSHKMMSVDERLTMCRVVGGLLLVDGEFIAPERAFLEDLMEQMSLPHEAKQRVQRSLTDNASLAPDVERLRRGGHSEQLLRALREAAMADGDFSRSERAMIARVRRIIQYRLGTSQYALSLERLDNAPISAHYDVKEVIGEGAFGRVFKASHKETGQACVIKTLKACLEEEVDPRARAGIEDRFWREVMLINKLQSPHTVRCFGAGFDIDVPYMVLEHIDGCSLYEFLRHQGSMSPHRVKHLMRQVLEAVAEAHDHGIVHRDLKPANIMLYGPGQSNVKVLDFGVSGMVNAFKDDQHFNITVPSQVLGTPNYMAPEQILQIDSPRRETDIYAIGLIMCECLTGRPLFSGDPYQIMKAQISPTPAPLPDAVTRGLLGEVITIACQKKWSDRFGPPEDILLKIESLDRDTPPEQRRALEQDLYRLYSPADEMLEAIDGSPKASNDQASSASNEKAPEQKSRFFSLLRRMLANKSSD